MTATVQNRKPPPPGKDKFCDLVMQGGVTSGVVYPPAIVVLSHFYRFKSIGGTSIGAAAAALTAAAEFARRNSDEASFDRLGDSLEAAFKGDGRSPPLLPRFQPAANTRRLFDIFIGSLQRGSKIAVVFAAIWSAIKAYWLPESLGVAVALAVLYLLHHVCPVQASWLACIGVGLVALVVALLALGLAIFCDLKKLVDNGYGLCTLGPDLSRRATEPAFVPWLHGMIQQAANRKATDDPLTFGDLWSAPGFEPEQFGMTRGPDTRSIDLQVISTCLTHGRPYRFPRSKVEEEESPLYFLPDDLKPYFPEDVLEFMKKHSVPDPKSGCLRLPNEKLPILVAVRLSLSFPLLISAVPLRAVDTRSRGEQKEPQRCWFSDGGICSNFPIHLFDAFVPAWPTFGITLEFKDANPGMGDIFLQTINDDTAPESWNSFDTPKEDARDRRIERLVGFAWSIVTTMMDRDDAMLTRMPGVRDRVVRLFLDRRQGGVNLKISGEEIASLARDYGKPAGEAFVKRFAMPEKPDSPDDISQGWREHRWIRLNTLLAALQKEFADSPLAAAADSRRHTLPLATQIHEAFVKAPLAGEEARPLSAAQVADIANQLAALKRLEDACDALHRSAETNPAVPARAFHAVPEPSLRVRPWT